MVVLLQNILYAQTTAIKIVPSEQTIGIDSSASISVRIEDVQELHTYSVEVSYNPHFLRFISLNRLDFFSSWQTFYYPFIDTLMGKIRVDEAILGPYSQSGSGSLYKINFVGLAEGDCALNISISELRNLNNQSIVPQLSNGLIRVRMLVDVQDEPNMKSFLPELKIYPNPFNSTAAIQFNAELNELVSLKIFDIKGEEIVNFNLSSSQNNGTVIWNGRNSNGSPVTSGIYFIRLEMPNKFLIKKAILLK